MKIISNRKNKLTKYGKSIKFALIDMGRTQEWLIAEVKKKTDKYIDCSNLNKIMTGRLHSQDIENAINEIISERT